MRGVLVDGTTAIARRVLPPEQAHRVAVLGARSGVLPQAPASLQDSRLQVSTPCGLEANSPIGIAAGFDKDCECALQLLNAGYSHVEIGSVTPYAQPGNEKPRVFRLPHQKAIINRLGFNSSGTRVVLHRLQRIAKERKQKQNYFASGVLGVNVGKNYWVDSSNAPGDYASVAAELAPYADYVTANVSSPNTPGLRQLQSDTNIASLVAAVADATPAETPLFVKIAPELDDDSIAMLISNAASNGATGVVVSNTTTSRPDGITSTETGGLSGSPLKPLATRALRTARLYAGPSMTLIGVGGVSNGYDVYEKLRAGASLVQFYTALVYHGPNVVHTMKRELLHCLERDGFENVQDAIGADVDA